MAWDVLGEAEFRVERPCSQVAPLYIKPDMYEPQALESEVDEQIEYLCSETHSPQLPLTDREHQSCTSTLPVDLEQGGPADFYAWRREADREMVGIKTVLGGYRSKKHLLPCLIGWLASRSQVLTDNRVAKPPRDIAGV